MAAVFLVLGIILVLAATGSVVTDGGRWSVPRLVVAVLYAAYAVWFFLRARRRDRAADAGGAPRG